MEVSPLPLNVSCHPVAAKAETSFCLLSGKRYPAGDLTRRGLYSFRGLLRESAPTESGHCRLTIEDDCAIHWRTRADSSVESVARPTS
jgi:hypothetical protein